MAVSENDSYQSYNSMVNQTLQGLSSLEEVCGTLQMEEHAGQLRGLRKRMQNQVFSVGIMGEFRRGKSTVINALLGSEIVPSDVVPTSATLNYVLWDAVPHAVVDFKDGSQKEVPVEELANYVTKTTKANAEMAATVEDAKVYYPCRFCQNGVQIIDTPGLNDDARMTKIAQDVIPTLDAVIMVLTAEIPFSASEADFVREKIMLSDLGRVIFVVNKIDNIRRKDRQRVLATCEERIRESVLEKMEMVYGKESEEYRGAAAKVGGIRVYGISAMDALEGRMEGDEELVRKSGILEFEDALSRLLTEERGMLELVAPVKSVTAISQQARAAIAMRRESMSLDLEQVETAYEEGMKATTEARNRAKAEVADLKQRATGLSQDLLPDVEKAYESIEAELLEYVGHAEITKEDMKNDKTAEARANAIAQEIKSLTEQKLNAATQALLVKMEDRVGAELAQLESVGEEIFSGVSQVQQNLIKTGSGSGSGKAVDVGVGVASFMMSSTPLFGVGAMINGWKENGLPGALVGGGVGLAAGTAAMYGAANVACVALGVAFVPALPFLLLGGVASSVAGGAAVKKIFKTSEKKIQKVRDLLSEHVKKTMAEVKRQRSLEKWLERASSQIYENISKQMDEEVEATLVNFERQLMQLKADRQMKNTEMAAVVQELNEVEQKLDQLEEQIRPVREKMDAAISSQAA